ncbi:50S ribosomal protein L25 [Chloroflexota bacterium]
MELTANTREILGKKVKLLRREGLTPTNLFGNKIEPLTLQCDTAELQRILTHGGRTGIITLKLDKQKITRNVMVREIQREPRSGQLLHVDFYQVKMDEKIRLDIPIVTIGEAPALKAKDNYLAQELNNLSIECLPDAIPNRIEVDVSELDEAEQSIFVSDIILGEGITIMNTPDQLVVKISTQFVEKEIEVEEEVEGEVEAEGEGEPGAEGEAPAEGRSGDSSDS